MAAHEDFKLWTRWYLQMSWFEGVTEVREKLQGAFTEVGLPAYERKKKYIQTY